MQLLTISIQLRDASQESTVHCKFEIEKIS